MAGFKSRPATIRPEYNGFKICLGKDTLYGEQIQEIRAKMERNEYREKPAARWTAMKSCRLITSGCLTTCPNLARPLKVVVDAGSGVGGPVAPPIFDNWVVRSGRSPACRMSAFHFIIPIRPCRKISKC